MPSIALFCSKFTNESEIKQKLSSLFGLKTVTDESIITEVSKKYAVAVNKLEQSMYHKTSVFNNFTMDRERCVALIKATLADNTAQPDRPGLTVFQINLL